MVKTHFVPVSLRGATLACRFLLTLYIARYLGLDPLGQFGIISGLIAFVPTALGFGIMNRLCREAITSSVTITAISVARYWTLVLLVYLALIIPTICTGFFVGSGIVAIEVLSLAASEHFSGEIFILLISLNRPLLANLLMFVRLGFLPLLFMAAGVLFPALNKLSWLIAFLLAGNLFCISMFASLTRRWPWVQGIRRPDKNWFADVAFRALPLYVNDALNILSQYTDRFIISALLGLQLTGVYVLFWSVGNAICTLVSTGVVLQGRHTLIKALTQGKQLFDQALNRLVLEASFSALFLSLVIGPVYALALPSLNKPLASAHISVFVVILGNVLVRMIYEALGVGLYGRSQDYLTLGSAILVFACSIVFDLIFIPLIGLGGAALATCVSYSFGLIFRLRVLGVLAKLPPKQEMPL